MLHDIKTKLPCPTCGKVIEWSNRNKWRPFCSERCRLIDLGAWVNGDHCIPGDDQDPDYIEH